MVKRDPGEIERRLNEGEWLQIGDLMILFGASRSTVDRWINSGAVFSDETIIVRYRERPGPVRECHPEDVRRVLEARRRIRSADPARVEAERMPDGPERDAALSAVRRRNRGEPDPN